MSRPCFCDNLPPEGEAYTTKYCRRCWLYHNDERYTKKWTVTTVDKITNLTSAITNFVKNGLKIATKEVFEARLKICNDCQYKTKDWRCSQCGCYLSVKARAESEKCPVGKWVLPVIQETKTGGCGCDKKSL